MKLRHSVRYNNPKVWMLGWVGELGARIGSADLKPTDVGAGDVGVRGRRGEGADKHS